MSVLSSIERMISGLVEGAFGRAFRSEVQPIELAHRLTREMDQHRNQSLSRTYAPNEYIVWLSPDDRERFEDVEDEVIEELSAHLLEHARRERLTLVATPEVTFGTDERLSLGEFGIQVRRVRPPADERHQAEQADHADTSVYQTGERDTRDGRDAAPRGTSRAAVILDGRRIALDGGGALIGRSRDCDVVVSDASVSRHHARIQLDGGAWVLGDLGSTNGTRINERQLRGPQALRNGDWITVGAIEMRFEER
jgi:hypothetical protein